LEVYSESVSVFFLDSKQRLSIESTAKDKMDS